MKFVWQTVGNHFTRIHCMAPVKNKKRTVKRGSHSITFLQHISRFIKYSLCSFSAEHRSIHSFSANFMCLYNSSFFSFLLFSPRLMCHCVYVCFLCSFDALHVRCSTISVLFSLLHFLLVCLDFVGLFSACLLTSASKIRFVSIKNLHKLFFSPL